MLQNVLYIAFNSMPTVTADELYIICYIEYSKKKGRLSTPKIIYTR